MSPSPFTIRAATTADLRPLVALENRCFRSDRLSQRQFRYLLTKAHATTLVAVEADVLLGYVLILFSRGTSMARLYSIAVASESRGRGVAKALVTAAERCTLEEERAYLRLEIRKDNSASIALFEKLGYRRFGELPRYYEDQMDGWRYERALSPELRPRLVKVPFYEQTLDFTCGPASLMMAMRALDPTASFDRKSELRIWREATTIYMTSGHGGCGPFGLALAAARRGFRVEVKVSDAGPHLIDSVRDQRKKEVIRLVQEDMLDQLESLQVAVHYEEFSVAELEQRFAAEEIPVVLTSSYAIYREKFPHWVVLTGSDEHFIYVHDPFVDYEEGETVVDSINMPIPKQQFERMTRYGKRRLRAAVLISRFPSIEE